MDLMDVKRLDNIKRLNKAGMQIYEIMRYIDSHDSVFREFVEPLQSVLLELSKVEISMESKYNHMHDKLN